MANINDSSVNLTKKFKFNVGGWSMKVSSAYQIDKEEKLFYSGLHFIDTMGRPNYFKISVNGAIILEEKQSSFEGILNIPDVNGIIEFTVKHSEASTPSTETFDLKSTTPPFVLPEPVPKIVISEGLTIIEGENFFFFHGARGKMHILDTKNDVLYPVMNYDSEMYVIEKKDLPVDSKDIFDIIYTNTNNERCRKQFIFTN